MLRHTCAFTHTCAYALVYSLLRSLNVLWGTHYQPIVHVDSFSLQRHEWRAMSRNESRKTAALTVDVRSEMLGTYRLLRQFEEALALMRRELGLTEQDTDDVKAVFGNRSIKMLALTYAITLLHVVFDFLAFRSDIGFWRGRKDLAGLSRRAIVGNWICSVIIFLYLLDNEATSVIILASVGFSVIVDGWKVSKVLDVSLEWRTGTSPWLLRFLPQLRVRARRSALETGTEQFDVQAMVYLGYALYPLVAGWALYSLLYTPHRSWYSWLIGSLANGVYAFGFIMMTPQLFINYKMKSVAHLPWRALTYKAFNTFIDDVFSFIMVMPTMHRLACLRDDLVFCVYLYQRWCYPVDKTRVNEYGYVYAKPEDAPQQQNLAQGARAEHKAKADTPAPREPVSMSQEVAASHIQAAWRGLRARRRASQVLKDGS